MSNYMKNEVLSSLLEQKKLSSYSCTYFARNNILIIIAKT